MTVIPCEQDPRLRAEIERFAEVLKTHAHRLGEHGLDEASFYASPIFRGAIEKVRGEFSATMRGKREFVQHVLNHMEDDGHIAGWDRTQGTARNDYYVRLKSGRLAARRRSPTDISRSLPDPTALHLCVPSRDPLPGPSAVDGTGVGRSRTARGVPERVRRPGRGGQLRRFRGRGARRRPIPPHRHPPRWRAPTRLRDDGHPTCLTPVRCSAEIPTR